VFDLDPGEGIGILECCEVALLLRDLLSGTGLRSLPKVAGSKGVQVHVPLNTTATYAATQPFAKSVAELLGREHPKLVVSEMAKAVRAGKVFMDWSQNSDYKTTVGVYSLRAKRQHPFVAMPVTWETRWSTRASTAIPAACTGNLERRSNGWRSSAICSRRC
jgi:bifunctional non-homologous end joining protein LigD